MKTFPLTFSGKSIFNSFLFLANKKYFTWTSIYVIYNHLEVNRYTLYIEYNTKKVYFTHFRRKRADGPGVVWRCCYGMFPFYTSVDFQPFRSHGHLALQLFLQIIAIAQRNTLKTNKVHKMRALQNVRKWWGCTKTRGAKCYCLMHFWEKVLWEKCCLLSSSKPWHNSNLFHTSKLSAWNDYIEIFLLIEYLF